MKAKQGAWLVVLVAVGWAAPVGAQGRTGRGPGFHPGRIEAAAAELGVNEATLAKIKDLAYKAETDAIAIRAEMQRAELELKRLMDQDKPDTAAVMRQVEQVGAVETRMRKNRTQLLLAVRELLTPEQRARLTRWVDERRGRSAGPGGPGRGPGPGMGQGPGPGPCLGDGPCQGMGPGMGGGRKGPGRP
jgi:Spy/CpxP family protein refolding chaperone